MPLAHTAVRASAVVNKVSALFSAARMGGKGKKRGDVKEAEARIRTADAAVMAAMAGALHQKAGYGQTPAAPTPQQQQQRAQPKDGTHAAPYVQHTTEQLRKHLDQQQRQHSQNSQAPHGGAGGHDARTQNARTTPTATSAKGPDSSSTVSASYAY